MPYLHESNQTNLENPVDIRVAIVNRAAFAICNVLAASIQNSGHADIVAKSFTPSVSSSTPYERSLTSGHQFDDYTGHSSSSVSVTSGLHDQSVAIDMAKKAQDARAIIEEATSNQSYFPIDVPGELKNDLAA